MEVCGGTYNPLIGCYQTLQNSRGSLYLHDFLTAWLPLCCLQLCLLSVFVCWLVQARQYRVSLKLFLLKNLSASIKNEFESSESELSVQHWGQENQKSLLKVAINLCIAEGNYKDGLLFSACHYDQPLSLFVYIILTDILENKTEQWKQKNECEAARDHGI